MRKLSQSGIQTCPRDSLAKRFTSFSRCSHLGDAAPGICAFWCVETEDLGASRSVAFQQPFFHLWGQLPDSLNGDVRSGSLYLFQVTGKVRLWAPGLRGSGRTPSSQVSCEPGRHSPRMGPGVFSGHIQVP